MKLLITHLTRYEYTEPVQYALQSLCLTPQECEHQSVLDWSLHAPAPLYAQRDGYGNVAHTWSLVRRAYASEVRASGVVETHGSPVFTDGAVLPQLFLRATPLTDADAGLRALGAACLGAGAAPDLQPDALLALARAVVQRVPYATGSTGVTTSAAQAWSQGAGVCQDHAHVFIAACRASGVPARYVSGYFHAPHAPHLASHAWVDVCVDVAARRWLSIDVTNGCLMDERHVRLAVGPDYAACSPVRGVREGGGAENMHVRIDIHDAGATPAPAFGPLAAYTQSQSQRAFQSPEP